MAKLRKRNWTTSKGESRIGWAVDYFDSSGTRQRRQFTSRREADDFRIEIEGQLRKGTYRPDAEKITVKDAAELFIAYCERRMKRGERMTRHNYAVYEGHVRNYICPDPERHARTQRYKKTEFFNHGIGNIKLAQLTGRAVGDFRDHLRDTGLSVASTRKILGTLKLVLSYAVSRDLLAYNVAHGVKVIGRRNDGPKKIVPPTKEAMKQLIAIAKNDSRVKLIFAAMTGLRASELHALRWRHIDFAKAEVKIETRVDAYGQEDVTKTAAGMRTVPLGADVIRELQEWRDHAKRARPEDLVFPNRRGGYEDHANMVKRDFAPLFEKLARLYAEEPEVNPEPPARFNWHALRHFAISCWIDAGLTPKTVQTFAGHSTLSVTMDRYGHLFKSDDHRAAMDEIARQFAAEGPVRSPVTGPNARARHKEVKP